MLQLFIILQFWSQKSQMCPHSYIPSIEPGGEFVSLPFLASIVLYSTLKASSLASTSFSMTLRSLFLSTITFPSFFPLYRHLWLLWSHRKSWIVSHLKILTISHLQNPSLHKMTYSEILGIKTWTPLGWDIIQSTRLALTFLPSVIFILKLPNVMFPKVPTLSKTILKCNYFSAHIQVTYSLSLNYI